MKAFIQGIGVVGGFGYSLDDLKAALCRTPPEPQMISLETANGTIEVPAHLADTKRLEDFVPKRELRRTGHYIRMAMLAAHGALEDAGIRADSTGDDQGGGRTGIIVATGYGATCNTFDFQHSVINASDPCGSPTVFANSVHNAAASHLSISLKKMGPNLSLSHYDMSVPSAFATALQWLDEGSVDTVLVGGVDEYCKVLGYYWHLNQKDQTDRRHPNPYVVPKVVSNGGPDVIGEGSCFFVLSREDRPDAAYGMIESVHWGHGAAENMTLPHDAVYYIGTDSYSECDSHYADILPAGVRAAVHSHVFGGVPIGIGFEVAIAALSNQTGTIFRSAPIDASRLNGLSLIQRDEPLSPSTRACCLKLGAGKAYGAMILRPS